jgi:CheY-like chemotaxis protein
VLFNLVGNAVKFTSEGAVTIMVQAVEQLDNSVVLQIAVRDTGIGISAESLEHIFMPFVQEDGSVTRHFGGTGLGLSISRRLAELMGGGITVESTPGVGSCFCFTFPASIAQAKDEEQFAEAPAAARWEGEPLRILFVEDDPVSVKLGLLLFKKLGHQVVAVANGQECLEALGKGGFDLVLMDVQMPVMNGEEALVEIRRREQGSGFHMPVIALTAYALRGERDYYLEMGFDGHVSKPVEFRELLSEIEHVLCRIQTGGGQS